MKDEFTVVGGTVYINKDLFAHALSTENNLSFLAGNCCSNMFRTKPMIRTGIESVTIDYSHADEIPIARNLDEFIDDITNNYHSNVRGQLTVLSNNKIVDVRLH